MKYAIEEAEKVNSNILFGGLEINTETLLALKTERRMDLMPLLYRALFALHNKRWKTEQQDNMRLLNVQGGEAFSELIDNHRANWFIKLFEKYSPHQKKILIDQKDVDLFHDIYRAPGQKIVAVVNQWHTQGIEAHWRHSTGTEIKAEPINPVGDMDIEKFMESELVNDKLRRIVSTLTKSEPATWQNYYTQYHKETQELHRNRHVYFLGHKDHDIHHGLFGHEEEFHFKVEDKQFPSPHEKYEGSSKASSTHEEELKTKEVAEHVEHGKHH